MAGLGQCVDLDLASPLWPRRVICMYLGIWNVCEKYVCQYVRMVCMVCMYVCVAGPWETALGSRASMYCMWVPGLDHMCWRSWLDNNGAGSLPSALGQRARSCQSPVTGAVASWLQQLSGPFAPLLSPNPGDGIVDYRGALILAY